MQKSNNTEEREKTMKKIVILSAMMFAVALWFGSTVSAEENLTSVTINTGSTPPEGDTDSLCGTDESEILEVVATSDGTNDEIIVTVTMDNAYDNVVNQKKMVKYRLRIDHKPPGDNAESYGGSHEFTPDTLEAGDCLTSSDDGVMYRVHKNKTIGSRSQFNSSNGKVYGPGTVDDTTVGVLVFTVPYDGLRNAELENPVEDGNTVHLWVDVQYKGICDRAPDTYEGPVEGNPDDACSKPELTTEVISIKLN
jgi:hypothetical protein